MVYSKKLTYLILGIVLVFNSIGMAIYSYLGRYLQSLGTSEILIQVVVSLFPLSSFVFPPILGRLSDKYQNRRQFILLGALSIPLVFILFIFIKNLILITFLVVLYGFCSSLLGLSFILFQEVVFNNQTYISYYNSMVVLGWFFGAQLCGIFLDFYGIGNLFIFLLIISVLLLSLVIFLKEDRALILNEFDLHQQQSKKVHLFSDDIDIPVNPAIYYGLFFRNFGIRPIMSILTIIMALHLSTDSEIGFLIGINPLIQFFLMILMGRIISQKNEKIIMILGYILSGVVVLGYIISVDFFTYFFFQILVSFSYSMFWSATHFYIAQNTTPENKGQYIGIANSSFYLGSFLGGMFLSGMLAINPDYYFAMIPLISFPLLSALIISIKFKHNNS
ncbi:MAG: MFS transporter [Candidatus Lokiarchaeota archaeon]|nr:MFS transporter [Candidatus Lokiarchaeota archaeon]